MVKRRGDKTPEPQGGRAAERLRMFEQARQADPKKAFTNKAQPKEKTRGKNPEGEDEDKARSKDR